jgi:hypothetical protein
LPDAQSREFAEKLTNNLGREFRVEIEEFGVSSRTIAILVGSCACLISYYFLVPRADILTLGWVFHEGAFDI